jgi:hypothetical protein
MTQTKPKWQTNDADNYKTAQYIMGWYRHFKIRNARFDDLTKSFNHINFNEVISGMSLISIALLDTPVTLIK